MKKIIISAFALAMTTSAMAQITKGSLFLGLDLGFGSQKTEYSSTIGSTTTITDKVNSSSWNLGPTGQYFIMDNASVGLGFSFNHNSWHNEDPQSKDKIDQTSSGMGINLFGRKYFTCAETFYTFGELNLGLSSGKGETEDFDNSTSTTTKTTSENGNRGVALNWGFAWMATPRIMMQGSFGVLGFNSYNSKYNINAAGDNYQEYKGSSFNFSLSTGNIPFNLGFAYRISGGD